MTEEMEAAARERAPEADWRQRYEEERLAFARYREEAEARESEGRRRERIQRIFSGAGLSPRRQAAILRLAQLPAEENPREEEELILALKDGAAEEAETRHAEVPRPPRGERTVTRGEILAIPDAAKRQAAIAKHHELFGF